MCMQTKCGKCGKPTWAGCGAHIEQALANVPRDQRCRCREQSQEQSAKRQLLASPAPDKR